MKTYLKPAVLMTPGDDPGLYPPGWEGSKDGGDEGGSIGGSKSPLTNTNQVDLTSG
ncbi:MAG: hypothetical protein IKT99_03645 [Oscillospiraceae bacterium]|nr:hypothetical protein [Oscillospiraceae bacterium]